MAITGVLACRFSSGRLPSGVVDPLRRRGGHGLFFRWSWSVANIPWFIIELQPSRISQPSIYRFVFFWIGFQHGFNMVSTIRWCNWRLPTIWLPGCFPGAQLLPTVLIATEQLEGPCGHWFSELFLGGAVLVGNWDPKNCLLQASEKGIHIYINSRWKTCLFIYIYIIMGVGPMSRAKHGEFPLP